VTVAHERGVPGSLLNGCSPPMDPCESCGTLLYRGEDIDPESTVMCGRVFHELLLPPPTTLVTAREAWAEHKPFRCEALNAEGA